MIGIRSLTDAHQWITVGEAWTRWTAAGVSYFRAGKVIYAVKIVVSPQVYELREWGWVRVWPQGDARPAA